MSLGLKAFIAAVIGGTITIAAAINYTTLEAWAQDTAAQVNSANQNTINQANGLIPGSATMQPASGQGATSGPLFATLTQTSVIDGLAPGSGTQTIYGTIGISGGDTAYVHTITPTVTGTSDPGCGPENFTTTPFTYDAEVAGVASNVEFGSISFNDSPTVNQDACIGVTVYISYTSN